MRDGIVSCRKSPNCEMEWRKMENIQRWNLELLKESKLRDRTLILHFLFISKSKKLKSASSTLAIWLASLTFGTSSGTRFCLDLPCLEELWWMALMWHFRSLEWFFTQTSFYTHWIYVFASSNMCGFDVTL